MTFAELFQQYWWLMFPIFGMAMGFWGMVSHERRARAALEVVKTYVEQGKEPPPEMMALVKQGLDEDEGPVTPSQRNSERAWSFFIFAGIAAGFAVAYAFTSRTEDWAWVFLAVAVAMSVMAFGALVLLILGRKS